jgi:hypothetical protein
VHWINNNKSHFLTILAMSETKGQIPSSKIKSAIKKYKHKKKNSKVKDTKW